MKKYLNFTNKQAILVVACLLVFSISAQSWEVLPQVDSIRSVEIQNTKMVSADNEVFLTTSEVYSQNDPQKLFKLSNGNWARIQLVNDYFNGTNPRFQLGHWQDSILVIGALFKRSGIFYRGLYFYQDGSFQVISEYETDGSRYNLKDKIFLASADGIVYIGPRQNRTSINEVAAIHYNGFHDTISKFDYDFWTYDYLISAGPNSFYVSFPARLGVNLASPCWCMYNIQTASFQQSPFIDVDKYEATSFDQGMVMSTRDYFNSDQSAINRRVIKFIGTNRLDIGDPDFQLSNSITRHKNDLYLFVKRSNGFSHVEKYDGLSYSTPNLQHLQYFHFNPTSANDANPNLIVIKDYLFGYGFLNLIDSNQIAYGIVRLPLLNAMNNAPQANNDTFTTPNDTTPIRLRMRANDIDPDGDYLFSEFLSAQVGQVELRSNDDLQYTPVFGFSGKDTLYYRLFDQGGLADTAMIVVEVAAVVSEPITLQNDLANLMENDTAFIDFSLNDNYGTQNYAVRLLDSTLNGELLFQSTGLCEYRPTTSYAGLDSFQYEVCRSYGLCDSAWVVFDVELINVPPVVFGEEYAVYTSPEPLYILFNDYDDDGDVLTYTIEQGPFDPGASWANPQSISIDYVHSNIINLTRDSIQYKVCDPWGECQLAWVKIRGNQAPIAVNDSVLLSQESTFISVMNNDIDPEQHSFTMSLGPLFVSPTAEVNICGPDCIRYKNPDFINVQDEKIRYYITDQFGKVDSAYVVLNSAFLGTNEVNKQTFNIYPNPAQNELFIDMNKSVSTSEIQVYDLTGKLLWSGDLNENKSISLQGLASGMYQLKVQHEGGVYQQRFFKK